MPTDFQLERQHAHTLLDLLPPAKLSALRSLLEVMVDEGHDEFTEADRVAIQAGLDSLEKHGSVPMEEILADFGLTEAEFEKITAEPVSVSSREPNG